MLLPDARAMLRSRRDLARAGLSGRALAAEVNAGALRRVGRGWYVAAGTWQATYAEGRHLLRIAAAAERRPPTSSLVFSHCSAAVLWGLPLFRTEPRRVHVSGIHANGHVAAGDPLVARHEVAVPGHDIVEIDGIPCTSLARTVADTVRMASEEAAIAVADAAIRLVAWDATERSYDTATAEAFRAGVRARLPRGGRGVVHARAIVEFADGRAQLPGESVSRWYLSLLGYAPPRLQVAIPGPSGRDYFVDFGLDDVGAWGEFDGLGKYSDPAMLAGRTSADVMIDEKRREDWIRGTTGRPFARWELGHVRSPAALAARLRSFHLSPGR